MNKSFLRLTLGALAIGVSSMSIGQVAKEDLDKGVLNWYNGGGAGMQTEKAYGMLKKRNSETVVVAVIDSGVDIEHEDLQGKIWTNEDEIPGNGIDDDKNGYIDDIHGWNFLGNANGENANDIRLEVTRIYADLHKKYGQDQVTLSSQEEVEEFMLYQEVKETVEGTRANAEATLAYIKQAFPAKKAKMVSDMEKHFGKSDVTIEDLEAWKVKEGSEDAKDKAGWMNIVSGGFDARYESIVGYFEGQLNFHYNPEHDGRAVIGDNPDNFNDNAYGNNDVEGPDAGHGTHVSGIIGATRGNELGNDGVCDNVLIMSLRAVPNGDEYDKDIALAIRYAVDNGAKIINMSFGKAYSPHQEEVYEAFKYADSKGVLCVHAAGNDHKNVDEENNFPTSMYSFQQAPLDHFMTIGASTRFLKEERAKGEVKGQGGALAASFSNYGSKGVDVFAPGHDIWSTVPQSEYDKYNGTSMACPMVAGAAALLKSYFPKLSMKEIKEILLSTATSYEGTLQVMPGKASMDANQNSDYVDFGTLSVTGGVINLVAAVKECLEREKAAAN